MPMIRPADEADLRNVAAAIAALRDARDCLARAGAPRAWAAVSRALKSAEGAARHIRHRIARTR